MCVAPEASPASPCPGLPPCALPRSPSGSVLAASQGEGRAGLLLHLSPERAKAWARPHSHQRREPPRQQVARAPARTGQDGAGVQREVEGGGWLKLESELGHCCHGSQKWKCKRSRFTCARVNPERGERDRRHGGTLGLVGLIAFAPHRPQFCSVANGDGGLSQGHGARQGLRSRLPRSVHSCFFFFIRIVQSTETWKES